MRTVSSTLVLLAVLSGSIPGFASNLNSEQDPSPRSSSLSRTNSLEDLQKQLAEEEARAQALRMQEEEVRTAQKKREHEKAALMAKLEATRKANQEKEEKLTKELEKEGILSNSSSDPNNNNNVSSPTLAAAGNPLDAASTTLDDKQKVQSPQKSTDDRNREIEESRKQLSTSPEPSLDPNNNNVNPSSSAAAGKPSEAPSTGTAEKVAEEEKAQPQPTVSAAPAPSNPEKKEGWNEDKTKWLEKEGKSDFVNKRNKVRGEVNKGIKKIGIKGLKF